MNTKALLGISAVVNVLLLGTAAFLWKQHQAKPASPAPAAILHVADTNPAL